MSNSFKCCGGQYMSQNVCPKLSKQDLFWKWDQPLLNELEKAIVLSGPSLSVCVEWGLASVLLTRV